MRLISAQISDFRGFVTERTFDFDADAVIVVGANGNGKTSLFDAVLWALSGRIPRLAAGDPPIVSRFSSTGQARVMLTLREVHTSSTLTVTRTSDGKESKLTVETREGLLSGPEAQGRLIRLLWGEAATSSDPPAALATALTRSVYLQQDLVRQFIESPSDQERFNVISELVGAGKVNALQGELEKAKLAWTKGTNGRAAEVVPARSKLSALDSRLTELLARPASETRFDEQAWTAWLQKVISLGISIASVPPTSREVPSIIDAAIKQIDASRRAIERRQQTLGFLSHEWESLKTTPKPDPAAKREAIVVVREANATLRGQIEKEQVRVAELRSLQAGLREKTDQLRTLATLALKLLGDKCPVCTQDYDITVTRQRLEVLAQETPLSTTPPEADVLTGLLTKLATHDAGLARAEQELRDVERLATEYEGRQRSVAERLTEVGIDKSSETDISATIQDAFVRGQAQLQSLAEAQKTGEQLALTLSRVAELNTISELQREIAIARLKLQQEDAEIARRTATGEQAQKIIEALRDASTSVVTERVREIEPLLGEIYSRIDVHPAFRIVKFIASLSRGKGHLSTVISDPVSDVESDSPATVLSSSQLNALAVCTFLALNLGVANPPLDAAILDDPLQSLDDINLLGLIDLLRRTKDQRQLWVSTHDVRFGSLLARKLRPRSKTQRTVVIELDGWARTGPVVSIRDIHPDPAPLRLVAL